jgi:hypothetical protein
MSRDVHRCTHWLRPPPHLDSYARALYWSATSLYDPLALSEYRKPQQYKCVRAFGSDATHEGKIRQAGLMIHPELLQNFLCHSFRNRPSKKKEKKNSLRVSVKNSSGSMTMYGIYMYKPVFRIRIHFLRIRIQRIRMEANTDPDPDPIRIQGFNDQKLEKK